MAAVTRLPRTSVLARTKCPALHYTPIPSFASTNTCTASRTHTMIQQARSASTTSTQTYPHTPSVQHLLHEHNLSALDISKIQATGPRGRLLKGDVLAHLGRIAKTYPAESAGRVERLAKLDLSRIQLAATTLPSSTDPKFGSATATANDARSVADSNKAKTESSSNDELRRVQVSIDMSHVSLLREKIARTLGIDMPVSTLLDRASELANRSLPPSTSTASATGKSQRAIADELFESVLGLAPTRESSAAGGRSEPATGLRSGWGPRSAGTQSKGLFQIEMPTTTSTSTSSARDIKTTTTTTTTETAVDRTRKVDPFDSLIGLVERPIAQRTQSRADPLVFGHGQRQQGHETSRDPNSNRKVFSVVARVGQEKRAVDFLGRMKNVLEREPGRLVL